MATDLQTAGLPLELLDRAIPSATNDEMLELAYQVLENLAERSETAADFAIDADDRDVENEALVFISEVDKLMGLFASGRLLTPSRVVDDAKADLEKAIRDRRARLEGATTALEQFSYRRQRRAQTVREVETRRAISQAAKTAQRAKVTPDRVIEALVRVSESSATGKVRPVDVAVALSPELADTTIVGRQRVVNRVGRMLRELAAEGRVMQIRPDDYDGRRKLCRCANPGTDDAS